MASLRRLYVSTFLVLAAGALLTASMLQPLLGTRADFSVYNGQWNGASGFAGQVFRQAEIVPTFSLQQDDQGYHVVQHSFAAYPVQPEDATVVLLGPDQGPLPGEAAWLRRVLEGGGRVLLAAEGDGGNAWLSAMGASTRFREDPLLSLVRDDDARFAVVAPGAPHPVMDGVQEIVLNQGVALDPGPDARRLGVSFGFTWDDRLANLELNLGERFGDAVWFVEEQHGEGSLLILGDPSILINGMADLGDNRLFRENLAAWVAGDGRRVFLDESHRDYPNPVRLQTQLVDGLHPAAQVGLAFGALGLFLLFALGPLDRMVDGGRRWRTWIGARLMPPPEVDADEEALQAVLAEHPDWDENTLRTILVEWRGAP
ncbi:MAG: DUF4350 domain-containing protein [Thermoplasmatota archaeon]